VSVPRMLSLQDRQLCVFLLPPLSTSYQILTLILLLNSPLAFLDCSTTCQMAHWKLPGDEGHKNGTPYLPNPPSQTISF
jgi:hypothetical protein